MKYFPTIALWSLTAVLIICMAFDTRDPVTLWLMGDSTMSVKEPKAFPETGWGVPFTTFWNTSVKVENHAKNGRSTRTFIEEKRWEAIVEQMKSGDYLFIQFGHNDEVPTKKSYTSPEEYETNLSLFVQTAIQNKVIPVLITPVSRRSFDSTGVFSPTHEEYAAIVRKVATRYKITLIDLDQLSQKYFKELGPENSKSLFLHLAPNEHPNYPDGKTDDTHFNEYGARKIAQIVLSEIRKQLPALAERMVTP